MPDSLYNRWQGLMIGQFTVAIALVSSLVLAGIAFLFGLMQNTRNVAWHEHKMLLGVQIFLAALSIIFNIGIVVSRLLDFRLTARKVRSTQNSGYKKSLQIWGLTSNSYSSISWVLFWSSLVFLLIQIAILCYFALVTIFNLNDPNNSALLLCNCSHISAPATNGSAFC
ncbi:MAG: hypothetical protein KF881_03670 [Acidobacteria bacterium]|nr:hypothetical protein [Acidobacteriota bacterium]